MTNKLILDDHKLAWHKDRGNAWLREERIDPMCLLLRNAPGNDEKKMTRDIMAHDNRVSMLSHENPQGIGAAFWDGVDQAKGDIVSMFPGDNENNPWEILRYYKLLEHVDMVIPFVFNKETRPLFRNGLSFIYRFIINTTFLVYFNYTNGTVLYRKSILEQLPYRSTSFFFQTDILVRTVKRGYLFAEVPYRLGARSHGVSKAVTFPSLIQVIKGYFRLVRDIYSTEGKKIRHTFVENSLTAERYHENAEKGSQKIGKEELEVRG